MRNEDVDYTTVRKLIRDICFLYHELADYGSIMPDLDFRGIYRLPYWDFLYSTSFVVFESIPDEDAKLIREGCLVMIFTMAYETLDGAGSYLLPHLNTCKTMIDRLIPEDVRDDKLICAVKRVLTMVSDDSPQFDELEKLSRSIYHEFVHRYFVERAR